MTFLSTILLCPWYVICKNRWVSVLTIAVTRWWLFYLVQTFAIMTPPMGPVNQTDSFLSAKCTIIIREKLRLKQHKNVDSYVSGGVIVCAVIMTSSNESFFPRYWPFVREIHQWSVNSPHKGSVMWTFVFLWCGPHKLSNKHLNGRWFETTWRSCDVIVMVLRSGCLILIAFRKSPHWWWSEWNNNFKHDGNSLFHT